MRMFCITMAGLALAFPLACSTRDEAPVDPHAVTANASEPDRGRGVVGRDAGIASCTKPDVTSCEQCCDTTFPNSLVTWAGLLRACTCAPSGCLEECAASACRAVPADDVDWLGVEWRAREGVHTDPTTTVDCTRCLQAKGKACEDGAYAGCSEEATCGAHTACSDACKAT